MSWPFRPTVAGRPLSFDTGAVGGLQAGVRAPLYGLAAGVVLEIVAGALAFTTDALVPALVLCLVGLVLLGAAGDALRRS